MGCTACTTTRCAAGARAAAAAKQLDDPALLAVALAVSARGTAVPGATAEAEQRHAEAAQLVDQLNDNEIAARLDALAHLAGAELYLHRFREGHAHAARALRIGRATGQDQQFPLLHAILGMTSFFSGEPREAIDAMDAAIEAGRLTGNAQSLAWALYPRAKVAFALGDLDTAMSAAQEAVDLPDDGTPSHHTSHSAATLAQVHLELGNPARAAVLLERTHGGPDLPLAAAAFRPYYLELLTRCRLA